MTDESHVIECPLVLVFGMWYSYRRRKKKRILHSQRDWCCLWGIAQSAKQTINLIETEFVDSDDCEFILLSNLRD